MRRTSALTIAAAGLILAGIVGSGTALAADLGTVTAVPGRFTLHQHDNFGGWQHIFTTSDPNLADEGHDNGASSMQNFSSCDYVLHRYANYGGSTYFARWNSVDGDFSDNHFDNITSSVERTSCH